MAYVNPDTLQEVANILEDFDEPTLISLFKDQIIQDDSYVKIPINHLEPLYIAYKKATNIESSEEDDIEEIRTRFQNICRAVIQFIETKYGFDLDNDWIESQFGDLPAMTMALYKFFIVDFFYVVLAVLNNYIAKNSNDLYDAFKDVAIKRDVSSLTNHRTMSPVYATILSSLFDVTDYSFTLIDNETLFDYINKDYSPATIIHGCVERGLITGDFTRTIADIYKKNLELRSKVAIEIAFRIKERGYLPENDVIVKIDEEIDADPAPEETEPASESYVDIESDVDSQ